MLSEQYGDDDGVYLSKIFKQQTILQMTTTFQFCIQCAVLQVLLEYNDNKE